MKYKLVIFDFDGTLADSYPWFVSVFGQLAERFRLPQADASVLEELRSMDIRRIQKEYNLPWWKLVMIGSHLKKLMSSQIHTIGLVAGMEAVLDQLAELDIRLAVVTSNAENNVRRLLGPRIMTRIDYIESGVAMFGKKKKFQKILKLAGVSAHQALSIGDEVRDLKSAREAQIAFGAVTWGYTAQEILRQHAPDAVFDHPAQILEAVLSPN